MADTQEVDIVEAIVTVVECTEPKMATNGNDFVNITCADGKKAICWHPYLFKELAAAKESKSVLCVTIERKGYWNYVVGIEGVEKPPNGTGQAAARPRGGQQTGGTAGGGPMTLTLAPGQGLKVEVKKDEATLRSEVLASIASLVHSGAVRAEHFHGALASGDEYIKSGQRFMIVEGKTTVAQENTAPPVQS